ncbi:MAG: glutaminase [Devosia sp.]|nr:glutaminase [Devosia sp.]
MVLRKMSVEPSGDAFARSPYDERQPPLQAMVNAGAIAASALIRGEPRGPALPPHLGTFERFTGLGWRSTPLSHQSESPPAIAIAPSPISRAQLGDDRGRRHRCTSRPLLPPVLAAGRHVARPLQQRRC